jgi:hypothetical protein
MSHIILFKLARFGHVSNSLPLDPMRISGRALGVSTRSLMLGSSPLETYEWISGWYTQARHNV